MSLFLEKIEIEQFRGVNEYTVDNFGKWSSITGRNSTSKSTIIEAISFLGSNRMHDISDIPLWFKDTEVNRREIPVKVKYIFKLNQKFDEMMSDIRMREILVSMYEKQMSDLPTDEDLIHESYRRSLKDSLISLRTKGPLGKILNDALYKTIRSEIEILPDYPPYQPLFNSYENFKMPDQIFDEAKYLQITMKLSLNNGPEYDFYLLNEQKNILVTEEVFYHWLTHQNAIDSEISLAYIIGAVFIKKVISSPYKDPEPGALPTLFTSDGSNIKQFVGYCLAYKPEILGEVSKNFYKIFIQPIYFKKASIATQLKEDEILIKIGDDDDWFSLDKLSDGLFYLLRILLQLSSCHEGDIIIIDEPELHLHPGASKSLREILFNEKSKIQIITVTHSVIFLDPSFVDIIILNQNIGGIIQPQIIDSENVDLALAEIGTSGLDALLYDVIIWVEGPSDKIYFEKWLDLMLKDLDIPFHSQIGILPYGGSNLLHLNVEEIKSINRKSVFIIDSDKKSVNDTIKPGIINFKSQCDKYEIYCWITKKKEIENYIPNKILEKVYRIQPGMLSILEYDDVNDKLNGMGRKFEKVKLAKQVAPLMTIDHIRNDKDFYDELKKLILNLNLEITPNL